MFTNPTSIITLGHNEKAYIEACLRSTINNDCPNDLKEILESDVISTDATRESLPQLPQTGMDVTFLPALLV